MHNISPHHSDSDPEKIIDNRRKVTHGTVGADDERITRAAGVISAATLLSRIMGYLRDMIIASLFGAGLASDAFFLAFNIPNLLRRLFGEGSLSIAFVPVFSQYLNQAGRDEADRLAASAFRILSLVLFIVCGLGVLFAPEIVRFLAFGWIDASEKFALCVRLTRIMMPYVFFIGLVALCMGILNVMDHFVAPALAPVCLNLSMIAFAVTGSYIVFSETDRIHWLAFGVSIGGVLQLAIQWPFLIRRNVRPWKIKILWHPGLNKILVLMGPALFGSAVYQINGLVIRFLASSLPQGSVSYLYYADRLVQFPLGIFGIAAATALLPTLSRQAATKQWESFRKSFADSLRFVLFITVPAMFGLIVLREPIVMLLFKRGAFDATSTRLTADALLYYGIGLWAFAAVRVVLSTFYALQDTRTPVRIGMITIITNLVLSVSFMKPMQHSGLAAALSLASMLNLALLTLALRHRLGKLGWRSITASALKTLLCAGLMSIIVWMTAKVFLFPIDHRNGLKLLSGVLICIASGVLSFGALAYVFRLPELKRVVLLAAKRNDPK